MSQKIVTKKFGIVSIHEGGEDSPSQDSQKQRSAFLKNRFNGKPKTTRPLDSARENFYPAFYNFRSNWFCKNCHQTFHLQPRKKYKTLLEFDLKCQHCKSKNIIHGEKLSEAIRKKIPATEILELFKEDNWEMEFLLTKKSKYYLIIE